MARHRLWSADKLGTVGGALVGYLVVTFIYYWWHRWRHESSFLWRWIHQVHHSPQRIEVITSFYKHPLEILVNSALSSVILYLGVGLSHGPCRTCLSLERAYSALAGIYISAARKSLRPPSGRTPLI
jgi:sterol desaturase/sphingolipid hydroxylase (fatty acid hydroxylase superfamily)